MGVTSFTPRTLLKTLADGTLCVSPGPVGGTKEPSSPVIYDLVGANLKGLRLKTQGAVRMEFWASDNTDEPISSTDFSNIEWHLIGERNYSDPRTHEVDREIIDLANYSRYLKVEKTHGATVDKLYAYAS